MLNNEWLSSLSADFENKKHTLKDNIRSASDLVEALSAFESEEYKNEILQQFELELPIFFKKWGDIQSILPYLNERQIVFLSEKLSHTILLSLDNLCALLQAVKSPQAITGVLRAFQKQLPRLFRAVEHLNEAACCYEAFFGGREAFFKAVLPLLNLSSLIKKERDIDRLLQYIDSEECEVMVAKQAFALLDLDVSIDDFKRIAERLSENQQACGLFYQAAIKILDKLFNQQLELDDTINEIRDFLANIYNTDASVQQEVWVALQHYLPTVIDDGEKFSRLMFLLNKGTLSQPMFAIFKPTLAKILEHFDFCYGFDGFLNTLHPKDRISCLYILAPLLPNNFMPEHLTCFEKEDEKPASLVSELCCYVRGRQANTNEYFYCGIFRFFGAFSRRAKLDAAAALIDAVLDPEHKRLDPKHIAPLMQGGLGKTVESWAKKYHSNSTDFLKSLQQDQPVAAASFTPA